MRSEATLTDIAGIGPPIGRGIPRSIEASLAFVALVVSAPLIALAAVAIALSCRGPVLFRQRRVGQSGCIFTLYKLCTMGPSGDGPQVTAGEDNRVTTVGRILRKTKIDELPELWNVAKGEMSLVGPRPEVPRYVDLADPLWRLVLQAKPGITDPMTLRLRNEETLLAMVEGDPERFYFESLQPFKLKGYVQYLQQRSCWGDVLVLWRTAWAVFFPSKTPPPTLNEIVTRSRSSTNVSV